MTFTGFPTAALDFYDDLEMDNTKSYWEAHRQVYLDAVRAPMEALTDDLAAEFGKAKIFRPYRDVRFAKDKTPYKTHQGAFVGVGPSTGYYVELSPRGVRVGAGFYDATPAQLASIRAAMADDRHGPVLARMIAKYDKDGWDIGGDRLKTSPRGYPADHPRIDLLRHRSLFVGRPYGFDADALGPGLADRVRNDWRSLRPLVNWVDEHGHG